MPILPQKYTVHFREHRTPYSIAAEYRVGHISIVALTDNYFRILHVPTGICLCDLYNIRDAMTAANFLHQEAAADPEFRKALKNLSWIEVIKDGVDDQYMEVIADRVNRLSGTIPMANKHETQHCIYKNTPEFAK